MPRMPHELKEDIRSAGLSQADVAHDIGVSYVTLNQMLNDRDRMSPDVAQRIRNLLAAMVLQEA